MNQVVTAVDERGAGRPAGAPNKATREQGARLTDLAKSYTDIAFSTLVDVAINGSSDTARIAAANSILDRGYGRPKAELEEVVDLPLSSFSGLNSRYQAVRIEPFSLLP